MRPKPDLLSTALATALSLIAVTTGPGAEPTRTSRATGASRQPAASRAPTSPELRIAYWYDRRRPLQTFRHQVYDLRRKEYTPEVDRWLALVRERYPGYEAYVRDVSLAKLRGDTENHKIGAAVVDEFLFVGVQHGYDFGPVPGGPSRLGLSATGRPGSPLQALPRVGSTQPLSSPMPPFPVPIPYPRPHP